MIQKQFVALTAAIATAHLLPLSAHANPEGFYQGAKCGSGAQANLVDAGASSRPIFETNKILRTTIAGTGSEQRAGVEVTIKGLRPPRQASSGWENLIVWYRVPATNGITSTDNLIADFGSVSKTFTELGARPIKPGTWQAITALSRNGFGPYYPPLHRFVVFQKNTGKSTTSVDFGSINIWHFNQGGISDGDLKTTTGDCADLN